MLIVKEISKKNPIIAGMVLLLIALLLRINDIFLLKIDELWGEIIISKLLGFILIISYTLYVKKNLGPMGLHKNRLGFSLVLGFIITFIIYLLSYVMEYTYLQIISQNPKLIIAAIDPKQGVKGGLFFAVWLLTGNIINSFMEEGLFRGLLIPKLLTRYSFVQANILQALLFGLWHLVWPLKDFFYDNTGMAAVLITGSSLFIATTINGFIWGYMYYKTNSLWVPWISHTLANSVLNLVHIKIDLGIDVTITYRGIFIIILGLISMIFINYINKKKNIKNLTAWNVN